MRHPIVKQLASIVSAIHSLAVVPDRFAVPFAFQRFDAQWYLLMYRWSSVQDL
jgi:hypothetical protein